MKKKNDEFERSLTAKERKNQNRADLQKADTQKQKTNEVMQETPASEPVPVGAVETGFGSMARTRNKLWIPIVAGVLALLMILFAVLIPTVIVPNVRFGHLNNPVVVFHLSNGERIEIVVYEEAVPHAATNFLYLARIGFFNDTIIFDTTRGFVRFGQFENPEFTQFRTTNERFLRNVRNMTTPDTFAQGDSPFDYRLNNVEPASAQASEGRVRDIGAVSSMHMFSGTEFQIAAIQNPQLDLQSTRENETDVLQTPGRVIGHVTEHSLDVIARIHSAPRVVNTAHRFFTPPAQTISIRRTSVHGTDFWGKWRTFNWDEYFNTAGSMRVIWQGGSGWGGTRHPNNFAPR